MTDEHFDKDKHFDKPGTYVFKTTDIHDTPVQDGIQAEKQIREVRLKSVSHTQKLVLQAMYDKRDQVVAEIDKKVVELVSAGCTTCGKTAVILDGFNRALCQACLELETTRELDTHKWSAGTAGSAQVNNWYDQSELAGYQFLAERGVGADEFLRWYTRNYRLTKEENELPSRPSGVKLLVKYGLESGW